MLMSYYPAHGMGNGVDIGGVYATWAGWPKCKLFGIILNMEGEPAGSASKTLVSGESGTVLVNSWAGVKVESSTTATAMNGRIIGVDRKQTTTNENGYFELEPIKGLVATVSCPSFGKSVTVDTTGKDSIDLSEFF